MGVWLLIYGLALILGIIFRPKSFKMNKEVTRNDLLITAKILGVMIVITTVLIITGVLHFRISMTLAQSLSLAAFSLFLISPAEELFFRGLIGSKFNSWFGLIIGILLSSVLFGLAHWPKGLNVMILAGISGIFLSLAFIKTKSIINPIILHTVLAVFYAVFLQ